MGQELDPLAVRLVERVRQDGDRPGRDVRQMATQGLDNIQRS
jgi:hypothetical protein